MKGRLRTRQRKKEMKHFEHFFHFARPREEANLCYKGPRVYGLLQFGKHGKGRKMF